MKHYKIAADNPNLIASEGFKEALRLLLQGELVGVPTETVYGLAADATNAHACAKIFAAKGRPQFNPLISHFASTEHARNHALFSSHAHRLADAFWPGALTLVLPRRDESAVCDLATAGLKTMALRVPSGRIMRELAREAGVPIAAPSANRSGKISATTAEAVIEELSGRLSCVLDAGEAPVGVESTIVSLTGDTPVLLRPGGLAREEIESVLGARLQHPQHVKKNAPMAPGMLSSHYAPNARVRLNASHVERGEALLAFGRRLPEGAERASVIENLSPSGELTEAAARLFQLLRKLDKANADTIAVAPIPFEGLGEAINDRLRRAAAPRRKS